MLPIGKPFHRLRLRCGVRAQGLQRLAEEQAKRGKLLEDLKIWIEDADSMKTRRPNYNYQGDVRELWVMFGNDKKELTTYLGLLPESHQVMWKALASTIPNGNGDLRPIEGE